MNMVERTVAPSDPSGVNGTKKLTGSVLLYGQFSEITESHKQPRLIRQLI